MQDENIIWHATVSRPFAWASIRTNEHVRESPDFAALASNEEFLGERDDLLIRRIRTLGCRSSC